MAAASEPLQSGSAAARQRCPDCGCAHSGAMLFCTECGSNLQETDLGSSRVMSPLGVALLTAALCFAVATLSFFTA